MFSGKRPLKKRTSDLLVVAPDASSAATASVGDPSSPTSPSSAVATVTSASAASAPPLPREITTVMDHIRVNWDYMSAEQASGVYIEDYHQAFNDAIQTFSTVVENINESHRKVDGMKNDLVGCKEQLQCKRFDLLHLWLKSIQNKEMIRLLDAISGYLSNVKSILLDYLTPADRNDFASNAVFSINEALKEKKSKTRLKTERSIFRIDGSETSAETELLYNQLLAGYPTLAKPNGVASTVSNIAAGIIDKYSSVIKTGHRLLVEPDFGNVIVLYHPTVTFVRKVNDFLGRKSEGFCIFLDDFILSAFLPKIEERVLEHCYAFLNGPDTFVAELIPEFSMFPLAKCVIEIAALVQSMCHTLYDIPVHRNEFVRLIEMVLVKLYDRLLGYYRNQTAADMENESAISARWACEDEIVQLLLHNTLFLPGEWFITQIALLRVIDAPNRSVAPQLSSEDETQDSSDDLLAGGMQASTDSLPAVDFDVEPDLTLPLNESMSARFDTIINYYQELAETFLFALKMEIRCHCMYFLDLALREGNYYLEDEPSEPDPYVDALNQDLIMVEEAIDSCIPTRRVKFVFDGLPYLVMHILCANLRYVRRLNQHGVAKLLRNVQALQQCISNLAPDCEKDLRRARDYFALLQGNEEDLLKHMDARPGGFTYDEYKTVLDLIFLDRDDATAKKAYAAALDRLKKFFVLH
ncbi:hypothetical protein HK405_012485 [Cladochytrium tenue]|nr:hypothetical protein HK405_012485 [Cladochytrium tenue]